MSYILDALRRADAERQQGGVPGLHSPASLQPALPMAPKPWLLWGGAAVLLLGLCGGLAWWLARPAPVVVVVAAPVAAPVVAPVAAPAVAPVSPPPLPIVVSAAPAAATPTPIQAASSTAPPTAPPSTSPTASPTPSPAALPAAVQASAAPPKAVPLQQLAAELRRELPPLVVGGSVWSDNPGSRFVVLDGQVAHEGDTLAPGLVLERIQPKAVLLRWRDMRLEIKL